MCTVSVIPLCGVPASPLYRLVCNRDEQRSRPTSSDLVRRRLGDRAAGMPIDPPSGGTWIGEWAKTERCPRSERQQGTRVQYLCAVIRVHRSVKVEVHDLGRRQRRGRKWKPSILQLMAILSNRVALIW